MKKKYRVLVTREASESASIVVEADNVEEAEELALEEAENDMQDWEVDDGNSHEPYICDPGNCTVRVDDQGNEIEDTDDDEAQSTSEV